MTEHKVNLLIQCVATIFIITGMIAFKRINKFRDGLLVYALSIIIFLIPIALIISGYTKYGLIITNVCFVLSYFIPVIYMYKWVNAHNRKFSNVTVS